MCKNTYLQHNGVDIAPENTLRYSEGSHLGFKENYVMQRIAMDLGYPFYVHGTNDGKAITTEADVFKTFVPMCKRQTSNTAKTLPIATMMVAK